MPDPKTQLQKQEPKILTAGDYQKWIDARTQYVTATDAAKILGLSRFGGPTDVWLEKTGQGTPVDQNLAPLKWGRRMEPVILAEYHDEVAPLIVAQPWTLLQSARQPRIVATLDAERVLGAVAGFPQNDEVFDGRPVDAKNSRNATREWGESGTDKLPIYYAMQLAIQMYVTNAEAADLAVLFGGNDFRHYTVHRLPVDVEGTIIARLLDFWTHHVETRTPPPADGSDAFSDHLKKTFTKHTEEIRRATPQEHEAAVALAAAEEAFDIAEAEKKKHQNTLKAAIGAVKGIEGPKWKATWNKDADSTGTDWEAIAKAVALKHAEATGEAATKTIADLVPDHQKVTRVGSRKFNFTFNG